MYQTVDFGSIKLFGKGIDYWAELDARAQNLNVESLIKENVELKKTIAHYENIMIEYVPPGNGKFAGIKEEK